MGKEPKVIRTDSLKGLLSTIEDFIRLEGATGFEIIKEGHQWKVTATFA